MGKQPFGISRLLGDRHDLGVLLFTFRGKHFPKNSKICKRIMPLVR